MKTFIATVVLALIASFSAIASAEEWYCSNMQLQSHSFGATSNTYVITYKCDHIYPANGGTNRDVRNVTFEGKYNISNQKATEQIHEHVSNYHDGDYLGEWDQNYNSISVCDDDPWLSGGGCRAGTYSIMPGPPTRWSAVKKGPCPQSAMMLPTSVRISLNQEYQSQMSPPTLIQPRNGDKYTFPDEIGIMVMHRANRDIEFKIEWRPDAQHALQNVATSFITTGLGGVSLESQGELSPTGEPEFETTTARLHPHEKGEWTLRVKHQGATWWSDPVTFHVVTPFLNPVFEQLESASETASANLSRVSIPPSEVDLIRRISIISPQDGQLLKGDMTLKLELQGYPAATATEGPEVSLHWTWAPFSKPGEWAPEAKTMEVRPSMQGTELAIPRSAFKKNGIWNLTASIKVSEKTSIYDQVGFKILDMPSFSTQPPVMATVQSKFQATSLAPSDKQQLKIQEHKQNRSNTLKANVPKAMPTQVSRQRLKTAQMMTPKPSPNIISPGENKHIVKTGQVPVSARVSEAEASLRVEIEYQPFGAASFSRQPVPEGLHAIGAGTVKTVHLKCTKPGTYRFRIREDSDKALWSRWRTMVVGSLPAIRSADKNTQPITKLAPAKETLQHQDNPVTQKQQTGNIRPPKQKTPQPISIKPKMIPNTSP